jgi:exopolyphosphatase/guanosine-5'-triphosphate,3'-diphosphate pyrophosphatase
MTERYVHSDPIDRNDWRALRDGIDREIKDHIGRRPYPTPDLIGSGGTFTAIGGMALHDRQGELGPVQGYVLTRAEFEHQLRRLRESPLALRRVMPGLSPDRADIILAGAVAVSRLAKRLAASRILINDRGVRDGLLLEMISRLIEQLGEKPHRLEAARAFARKCRSNVRHCEHVAKLAGALFDGLEDAAELEPGDAELLTAAALMHDVGYLIRYKDHHLHAYHLIRHSDLDGFSADELEFIANLVRYHRRNHPSPDDENWARIREEDHERVRRLAGLLRLADGLDRTHAQNVRTVEVEGVKKRTIHASVSADADPWLEIGDAIRKSDLLEAAIGRTVKLRWAEQPAGAGSGV